MGSNPDQSMPGDASLLPEPRFSGFAEFFELEFKSVCKHLIAFGAQIEEARDATQEAMIQVAQRWDSIRAPRAYVRKVAMREYVASDVDMRRSVKASTPRHEAAEEISDMITSLVELDVIHRALEELPIGQRTTLAYVLSGFLISEIAAETGQKPDTVRSNLRHARKALRKLLTMQQDSHLVQARTGRRA